MNKKHNEMLKFKGSRPNGKEIVLCGTGPLIQPPYGSWVKNNTQGKENSGPVSGDST